MPKMKREAPSLSGKAETSPGGREDRTSEKAEKTGLESGFSRIRPEQEENKFT